MFLQCFDPILCGFQSFMCNIYIRIYSNKSEKINSICVYIGSIWSDHKSWIPLSYISANPVITLTSSLSISICLGCFGFQDIFHPDKIRERWSIIIDACKISSHPTSNLLEEKTFGFCISERDDILDSWNIGSTIEFIDGDKDREMIILTKFSEYGEIMFFGFRVK